MSLERKFYMVAQQQVMLDLNKFKTREEWIDYAKGQLPKSYSTLARNVLEDQIKTLPPHILYFAFISRGRGLHEGILDQIEKNNPHSVFPLNRAYTELISYLIYCNQNSYYIDVMVQIGEQKNRAKKSLTAIQDAISKSAPGLKRVYDTLSRYTHFNETGIYNTISFADDEKTTISWTEYPRWKNEDDFKVACSQIHDLSEAFTEYMDEFAGKYLVNYAKPIDQ